MSGIVNPDKAKISSLADLTKDFGAGGQREILVQSCTKTRGVDVLGGQGNGLTAEPVASILLDPNARSLHEVSVPVVSEERSTENTHKTKQPEPLGQVPFRDPL